MPAEQEFGLRDYLTLFGKELAPRIRIHHYEDLPGQTRFDRGTYILSAIDQLRPGTARLAEELRRRLAEVEGMRVLNHPLRTLGRHALLERLWELKRNRFRAVRAADDVGELCYPVFLRRERTHEGAITELLNTPDELDAALGRALLAGHPLRDLLVVEFCDSSDERGYFRKYSSFVVGTEVMARSVELGPHWMVKDETSDFSRDMLLEEQEYVTSNPHQRELAEIFAIAGVEYGRIDYSVSDGAIQTWEINTNPTVGLRIGADISRRPPELSAIRDVNREHFGARFRAAMAALDIQDGGAAMELAFDSRIIRSALGEQRPRAISPGVLRSLLRPLKPLLAPPVPLVFWPSWHERSVAPGGVRASDDRAAARRFTDAPAYLTCCPAQSSVPDRGSRKTSPPPVASLSRHDLSKPTFRRHDRRWRAHAGGRELRTARKRAVRHRVLSDGER